MPTPLLEKCSWSPASETVTSKYMGEKVTISTWTRQLMKHCVTSLFQLNSWFILFLCFIYSIFVHNSFFDVVFHPSELSRWAQLVILSDVCGTPHSQTFSSQGLVYRLWKKMSDMYGSKFFHMSWYNFQIKRLSNLFPQIILSFSISSFFIAIFQRFFGQPFCTVLLWRPFP